MNVLRDTHDALVAGAGLVDFHPIVPPWARVVAGGRTLGSIEEPDFPEQLRATEAGMDEAVRLGLFAPVAAETHELSEHYDDAAELIDAWDWELDSELERAVRASKGPIRVVEKVVFRLYRSLETGSTRSPTATRPERTTSP